MILSLDEIIGVPIEVHRLRYVIATLNTARGYVDVLFTSEGEVYNGPVADGSAYEQITIDNIKGWGKIL